MGSSDTAFLGKHTRTSFLKKQNRGRGKQWRISVKAMQTHTKHSFRGNSPHLLSQIYLSHHLLLDFYLQLRFPHHRLPHIYSRLLQEKSVLLCKQNYIRNTLQSHTCKIFLANFCSRMYCLFAIMYKLVYNNIYKQSRAFYLLSASLY